MQIDISARGFRLTEGLRTPAEPRVRFAPGASSGRARKRHFGSDGSLDQEKFSR